MTQRHGSCFVGSAARRTARGHATAWLLVACAMLIMPITPFNGANAQGQTPETPRPRAGTPPTRDQLPTGAPVRYQQQPRSPQQQPQQETPGTTTRTGRFPDRRTPADDPARPDDPAAPGVRTEEADRRMPQRDVPDRPTPGAPGPATGPGVVGPTTAPGPGAQPGRPGPTGVGRPGVAQQPGARMQAPGGVTGVNVTGQTAYEPAFDHKVDYPDVPDAGRENLITEFGPMPVEQFLNIIHMATDWNIIVTEAAKQVNLNFFIVDTSPRQALKILEKHSVYYEFDPIDDPVVLSPDDEGPAADERGFLYVMTEEEHLYDTYADIGFHQFQVVFADVTYVESMLSSLMSSLGRIITDPRTNYIYVWDTQDNITQMVKTVDDLDVPLEKRDYVVMHADLADVEGVVTALLGPNGRVLSDGRTGQMVVWDSPTQLDQVTDAVRRLDVPVEPVTYEISHIDAEDLLDSVEMLLSERGQIIADPRYNTLIVTDLPTRQQRVAEMIRTLDRELETRTWTIHYADIDFIANQIEVHIPAQMGEIVVNDLVHQITVTGLPERLDRIEQLIEVWDIKRRQVMIEAFLVDMGERVTRELNVSWSYFSSSNDAPVVVHSPTGAFPGTNQDMVTVGRLPYQVPLYGDLQLDSAGNITRPVLTDIAGETMVDRFAGASLGVALNYLDQTTDSKVLAAPRVTVQDGEEAIFENAERIPYASATTSFSNINLGQSTSRIEFVDVGVILRVLPRITEKNDILLDIAAEDSSAELVEIESFSTAGVDRVASRKAPQVRARNVETQLRVNSGETVVLGGLRQNRAQESLSKVPVLGDIPLVGRLFQSPSRSSENTTLMIFLTPTIVGERTFPEANVLTRAEEAMAQSHRHNTKSLVERIHSRVSKGTNEFGVSIGQGGDIHSEGQHVSLSELRAALFEVSGPAKVTVVIRQHPRAPSEVVTQVTEAAMEAGLRIEFDERMAPLVPVQRSEARAEAAPGA